MKTRHDFVTNSSSSSFILSLNDETSTIEDAYQLVRDFYIEYIAQIKTIQDICMAMPEDFAIGVKDGKFYCKDGKSSWENQNEEAIKHLSTLTPLDSYDFFYVEPDNFDWVEKCPTYEDYKKYWIEKMYTTDEGGYKNHGPFSICDYTKDTYDSLHYRRCHYVSESDSFIYEKNPEEKIDKTLDNGELSWYFDCLDNYPCTACNEKKCKYLHNNGYSYEMTKSKCHELKECAKKNLEGEELILKLLGRFAILSECGYIPDAIVEQIGVLSKYYCNHMG